MLTSPLADLLPSILPDSPDSDQPVIPVQEGHAGDTSRDHQDRMKEHKEPMFTDMPAHAPHDPRMWGESIPVLSS